MNLACCSRENAERALSETNDSVIDAVDKLLDTPKTKGDKYVPPTPAIDDGLTEEVRNKIKQARELFDALNAGRLASETTKMQAGSSVEILKQLTEAERPTEGQVPTAGLTTQTSGPPKEGSPAKSS